MGDQIKRADRGFRTKGTKYFIDSGGLVASFYLTTVKNWTPRILFKSMPAYISIKSTASGTGTQSDCDGNVFTDNL